MLQHLKRFTNASRVRVGTWEDATWAVRFYERQGFELVSGEEKDRLFKKYWNIPEGQIEASVVLNMRRPNRRFE